MHVRARAIVNLVAKLEGSEDASPEILVVGLLLRPRHLFRVVGAGFRVYSFTI